MTIQPAFGAALEKPWYLYILKEIRGEKIRAQQQQ